MAVNRNSVVMNLEAIIEARKETFEDKVARALSLLKNCSIPQEGTPISLSDAARKYDLGKVTLHGWAERGWVKTLKPSEGAGAPRLLDEHDVAYLATIFRIDNKPGGHFLEKVLANSK